MTRPFVLASNRGPISFERVDGDLVPTRGAGGLVSGLGPLVREHDSIWFAAALTDADREAASTGIVETEGFRVRSVHIDPPDLELAYNTIANETLWYVHHGLYDLARAPTIDTDWYEAWAAYRRYNRAFADALVADAPDGAAVLLQDHHLALVAPMVRDERPDVAVVHFTHTPFATPHMLRTLPELARTELLLGYLGARAAGFHTGRWSDDFVASCRDELGLRPNAFVSPLGPDLDDVRTAAGSVATEAELIGLDDLVGDRIVIARTDRIDLSKNLIRGFWAFDELLAMRPDLIGDVVFVAAVSPSRESVADYRRYRTEMEAAIDEINSRWSQPGWTPIHYVPEDNHPFAMAVLRRYDVLLVNPIRDGMNLVAKEGPLVNERNGVVLLSREAGAWDELAGLAVEVHPYDITQTAQAMASAIDMPADQRNQMAEECRDVVASRSPADWLSDQLDAAEPEGLTG